MRGKVRAAKIPEPTRSIPEPPSYLDDVGKFQYTKLAELLEDAGKLAQTDPKLIEAYASNYALLVRAVTDLQGQPLTFQKDPADRPFVNPLIGVVHNSTQKVRQIIADLALSPVTAKLVENALSPVDHGGKWQGVL